MLVLARQEGDGITFPDLNLEVEILKIQGSRVQVGVHAPREITVLRSELVCDDSVPHGSSSEDAKKAFELQHRLREVAKLLAKARLQWDRGDLEGVEKTLRSMVAQQDFQEQSVTQVSESPAAYDCRSVCQQMKVLHPDCPLHDGVRAEGLAC